MNQLFGLQHRNRVGSAVHFLRCSVAVLQFQNKLYESQKLTLYLYIYIYINIEVFLGYRNPLERTATLQQLQQRDRKRHRKFEKSWGNIHEPQ